MALHVVITGDRDLSGQLYRQLRDAIRSGRLAANEQLPPSRLLAGQLKISRKTVSEVYARLAFERLLVGRVGVGIYPLAPFQAATTPRDGLLLGFGAIDAADIDPALGRVRAVLEQLG